MDTESSVSIITSGIHVIRWLIKRGAKLMTGIIIRVAARLVEEWRGTEHYQVLVNLLARQAREYIPDHYLEPQIGQVFIDVGEQLQATPDSTTES